MFISIVEKCKLSLDRCETIHFLKKTSNKTTCSNCNVGKFPHDSPSIRFKVRLFATTRLIRIWRWAVGLHLGVHQSDHRNRKAYTWGRGSRDVDTQLVGCWLFNNCSFFATRRLFPFRHLFGHGVLLSIQHGRVNSFQTLLFLFLFKWDFKLNLIILAKWWTR